MDMIAYPRQKRKDQKGENASEKGSGESGNMGMRLYARIPRKAHRAGAYFHRGEYRNGCVYDRIGGAYAVRQGKKPTVRQRELISSFRLNWENWLVVREDADTITIRHRLSDKERTLPKWRDD